VNWGDGSNASPATISGTEASPGRVNSLYAITAEHTYHGKENHSHKATIAVRASTGQTETFTVRF